MSHEQQQQRPAPTGYTSWHDYWKAQDMPWRTEPEIDNARQRYLARRRAVSQDSEKGIYPFRDEKGGVELTRADVEWLLATHEGGRGPVVWDKEKGRPEAVRRIGLDLRGADLRHVDLHGLPLSRLVGGVNLDTSRPGDNDQRAAAAIQLQRARLVNVHLEGANLAGVHLEGASLRNARLMGADVREVYFDVAVSLLRTAFAGPDNGAVRLADVRWGGVNLAVVNWEQVQMVGDERAAWDWKPSDRDLADWNKLPRREARAKERAARRSAFEDAVRAYRQVAAVLRDQGINEHADRFAYRAQVLQRRVLWLQRKPLRTAFSWFLDLLAGHGYKPERSLIAYVVAILGFAVVYFALGRTVGPELSPLGAFVFSMTSFHGRGFFPGGIALDDPITVLAAFEAFVGLVIEVSFIATFSQRFFAR